MDALIAKVKAMRGSDRNTHVDTRKQYKNICKFISDAKLSRLVLLDEKEDHLQMWRNIKSLPDNNNKRALTYIKGVEIDLHNILRIYRLRKYFPKAEVYPHLIPAFYRLNKYIIKQMVESPGVVELSIIVKYTFYGHVFNTFEEAEVVEEMQKVFARMEKRYPKSMACVFSYFYSCKMVNNGI